jgi:thiol-disulfide isomerase/thioredoxin
MRLARAFTRRPGPTALAGALALLTLGVGGADVRVSPPAAAAQARAAAEPSRFVAWRDPAPPPLALKDPSGRVHTLDDYRGQVVLVNFWATWCDPCRDEMPSMQRLKERLAGRPFTVLAVNYGESAEKAGAFLGSISVDFRALLDPGQQAARAWRVRVLPASFLVDPDGRLRYGVIGEIDWASAESERVVLSLLR